MFIDKICFTWFSAQHGRAFSSRKAIEKFLARAARLYEQEPVADMYSSNFFRMDIFRFVKASRPEKIQP